MPFKYTSASINSSLSWSFNGVFDIGIKPSAGIFISRRKRASVPPGQIHLVILKFLGQTIKNEKLLLNWWIKYSKNVSNGKLTVHWLHFRRPPNMDCCYRFLWLVPSYLSIHRQFLCHHRPLHTTFESKEL